MAEPLLSIPSSKLTQVIPNPTDAHNPTHIPLKSGVLTVSAPITGSPKLLLELAGLTIPLSTTTQVRTHAKDENRYLITLPLTPTPEAAAADFTGSSSSNADASSPRTSTSSAPSANTDSGMVELTLPDFIDPSTALRFEELLVQNGFLATGLVADADDLVSTIQSAAASVVDTIGGYAKNRIKNREPVEPSEASRYSDTTHKVVEKVAAGTGKTAEVTGKAAGAVENAGQKAGNYVGEKVGVSEGTKEVVEAVETLGGIGEAAGAVTGVIGEAGAGIIENEKGTEARQVFDGVRDTTGNVGLVVKDVLTGTSVIWQAGVAGTGVGKDEQSSEMKCKSPETHMDPQKVD